MIIFTEVNSMLETLGLVPQWGRYHHLLRGINDLTYPMGRDTITTMSHLVVIFSCALFLSGSVTRGREGMQCVLALVS